MSTESTWLGRTCERLNAEGARYVVVGTHALQLWGSVQPARALRLVIEPSPANAARVLRALGHAGFVFAREWMAAEVATRAVTVIGTQPRVDLLTVAGGVGFETMAARAVPFRLGSTAVPAASLDDLIAMRRTRHPADGVEVALLEAIRGRLP